MKRMATVKQAILIGLCLLAGPVHAVPAGRVWHVSPAPLPSVAASSQFRTIGEAAKQVHPGDVVLIHTGVYRESVSVTTSGTPARPIRFEAAPAATVLVTGADPVSGWQKEPGADNVYSVAWPYSFLNNHANHTQPEDDYHKMIGRTEQVFVQNYPLHQVLQRSEMSRGSFFADLNAKRLYVWDATDQDLNNVPVQASTRQSLWDCAGDNVEVRGLGFRYAANAAQQGAAHFTGRGDVVRDCTFEDVNGCGVRFEGLDQRVSGCTIQDNGQLGFAAVRAHNLHVSDCLIQNNNVKDFDRGWEAGGNKTALTRGAVIDHCRVLNNRGCGLWFDIGNENCEVKNCLIAGNEDIGLYSEISYGLHAHDNVIVGNGFGGNTSWGTQAGITLYCTPGCVIERNLLVGNVDGFDFKDQLQRGTIRIDGREDKGELVWTHDEAVRHNVLADNGNAQFWGWFDDDDEREWPKAKQAFGGRERPNYMMEADFEKHLQAEKDSGVPTGLSLEALHVVLADNLYDASDGHGLFHWGVTWMRNQGYADLASVRRDLALEQGSVSAPFRFGDFVTRDFRVPVGSPALRMGCYPIGTVPGVQLGVLPVGFEQFSTAR